MTLFARFCLCGEVMEQRSPRAPYAAEFACPANCGAENVLLTFDQVHAESRPSVIEQLEEPCPVKL